VRTAIDTNILYDLLLEETVWTAPARRALASASERGALTICPVVYAEVSVRFTNREELERFLFDFTADKQTKAVFTDDTVKAVERRTRELGVLVSANGTAIEMAPPLVARREELDRLASALEQAIRDVARARGLG